MPTYEYRCKDCGEQLEVVQAFADDPLTECPRCGGNLKKVFNSVGIAFKGSGFYKNDSRSSSSSGSGSSGSSAASSDGGSSSTSTAPSSDGGSSGSSDAGSSTPSSTSAKTEATAG
jgi:putative FmdB family regulatory protein